MVLKIPKLEYIYILEYEEKRGTQGTTTNLEHIAIININYYITQPSPSSIHKTKIHR